MSNSTVDLSETCCIDRDSHCLTLEQVERLYRVVTEPVQISPKEGNFPTLSIPPSTLARVVRTKLRQRGINVQDVRLNGSGASYCIAEDREKEPKPHYNDLDIIFRVQMKSELELHVIKDEVLSSLYQFFPETTQTDRISSFMLEESYVKKRVKVSTNSDLWSLISLGDDTETNIELKFVSSMKRQYEFSVDSFQIILDPLFDFEDTHAETNESSTATPIDLTPNRYPHIQAITLYKDFEEALSHLNNRLIATHNPEEIRGGGLLKYCYLLVNGYQPDDMQQMEAQEPYMCSRFFIDFPHMNMQFSKIQKYIFNRFLQPGGVPEKGLHFLETLLYVIANKAKCLMESERYKTIHVLQSMQANLIWQFSYKIHMYHQQQNIAYCHNPAPPTKDTPVPSQCRLSRSYSPGPTREDTDTVTPSCAPPTTAPSFINFPHTHNNAVPIGPAPTPVR